MDYDLTLDLPVEIDDDVIRDYVEQAYSPTDIFDESTLIEEISRTCDPGEVFSDGEITDYVRENFKSEEIFDETGEAIADMKTYVAQTYTPDEVYTQAQLTAWATKNGFIEFTPKEQ